VVLGNTPNKRKSSREEKKQEDLIPVLKAEIAELEKEAAKYNKAPTVLLEEQALNEMSTKLN
jgi:hypothetical protein